MHACIFFLLLVPGILALSDPSTLVLHEQRSSVPNGFTLGQAAPSDLVLNLKIGLNQGKLEGLEERLLDISSPSSSNYGKHLSKDEVESYVRPSNETHSAVTGWLSSNNVSYSTVSPANDWLSLSIPVHHANTLFGANFTVFEHGDTGVKLIRTMQYSIPSQLKGHLASVHPTVSFANPRSSRGTVNTVALSSAPSANSSCSTNITPDCLQDLYGIPKTQATQQENALGVSAFFGNYAVDDDLKEFLKEYRPDLNASTAFDVVSVDNGSNFQDRPTGSEANLDLQYTVGLASGVPIQFIAVGIDNANHSYSIDISFLDEANYLLNMSSPPQVVSTSYGLGEDELTPSLAQSICNAYMQLGARGVSVIFSSGDSGSGSLMDNDTCTAFAPTFPSGCPYVTSVGATGGISPEVGVDFSSGGFSNIWSRPSYQSDAVSSYLSSLGDKHSSLYNSSGRAFPDVSAQGANFTIIDGGSPFQVSGTSASCPTFASIISLLNDELIAAGKSPLGFLNPLLYENSAAFNDVTSGNNPGCDTDGFPATSGWDPVTGLGTPVYSKLRSVVGL